MDLDEKSFAEDFSLMRNNIKVISQQFRNMSLNGAFDLDFGINGSVIAEMQDINSGDLELNCPASKIASYQSLACGKTHILNL